MGFVALHCEVWFGCSVGLVEGDNERETIFDTVALEYMVFHFFFLKAVVIERVVDKKKKRKRKYKSVRLDDRRRGFEVMVSIKKKYVATRGCIYRVVVLKF